jgi:hypothetical protein
MTKKNNTQYEILTDSGWADFHGVYKKTTTGIVTIVDEIGNLLECTLDHKIETEAGFIQAQNLYIGSRLKTKSGYSRVANLSIDKNETADVYDALEVSNGHKYYTNNMISHNCEFLGSSGTLIAGQKLKEMAHSKPVTQSEGLLQYDPVVTGHTYAMVVDVSRGKGLDYSAFSVLDITQMPYKQVCTFRDNFTGPVDYAATIFRVATLYNEAHVMVEVNDIGGQVSDILFLDYGYENLVMTENGGRSGKRVSGGFGKNVDRGIRTTKSVKSIGCSILKMLIEQNQLLVPDFNTIQELSKFSKKGLSYEAESGSHDDLVMTLVLFSWLTDQGYFKDLTDINTMMKLREKSEEQIEEELLPFGFVSIGDELEEDDMPVRYNSWL